MAYRLIDTRDNSVVQEWTTLPERIHIKDVFSVSPAVKGTQEGHFKIVEVKVKDDRPTKFHTKQSEVETVKGDDLEVSATYDNPTVDDAKTKLKREIKKDSRDLLAKTDWYVTRFVELPAKVIPQNIQDKRAAIRKHANDLVAEVDALTTLAELDAWKETNWPDPGE